ncbi:MAG: hypothetical protein ACK5L3_06355, partial [Oscillospiraceae bacterium]
RHGKAQSSPAYHYWRHLQLHLLLTLQCLHAKGKCLFVFLAALAHRLFPFLLSWIAAFHLVFLKIQCQLAGPGECSQENGKAAIYPLAMAAAGCLAAAPLSKNQVAHFVSCFAPKQPVPCWLKQGRQLTIKTDFLRQLAGKTCTGRPRVRKIKSREIESITSLQFIFTFLFYDIVVLYQRNYYKLFFCKKLTHAIFMQILRNFRVPIFQYLCKTFYSLRKPAVFRLVTAGAEPTLLNNCL